MRSSSSLSLTNTIRLMFELQLKQQARDLGFDMVGIAEAVSPSGAERLREWLAKGHAGEMAYMAKHNEARKHPESIQKGVRSVVAVGMNYRTARAKHRRRAAVGGANLQLRLGRRLSLATARSPESITDVGEESTAGMPGPRRRRHRPAARTRLRPAGRPRLVRQEHDAHSTSRWAASSFSAHCCSTSS